MVQLRVTATPAYLLRQVVHITTCALLLLLLPASASTSDTYCGGDTLLDTPYFAPFHQTREEAVGCWLAPPPGSGHAHVLRLEEEPPSGEVNLHILGEVKEGLGLLLDSSGSVTWRLTGSHLPSTPPIILLGGPAASRVLDAEGTLLPSRPAGPAASAAERMQLATQAFQHVTTFTLVKSANKIVIYLPQATTTAGCNLEKLGSSPAVTAFSTVKQSTFGCFHPEAAGVLPQDVHVIDLKSSDLTLDQRRRRRETTDTPQVEVDLVPSSGEAGGWMSRNLTLILKSDTPVRWSLRSHGITGNLLVAAGENPVENLSVSWQQRMDIDKKSRMPDQFERLMRSVTEQFGLPLAYMRVHHANLLQMVVPPRSKREVSTFLERDRSNLLRDPPPSRSEDTDPDLQEDTDPLGYATNIVENALVKNCSVSRTEIAVPNSLVDAMLIGRLHLNDPSCVAVDNGTHHVVASHVTACGSTTLTYGNAPMYRNNLVAVFASGAPLAGQQLRIPYMCKFKPGIPGVVPVEEEEGDRGKGEEEEEEVESQDLYRGEEMYGLSVELLQEGRQGAPLLKTRTDSAKVALGDDIYVQSHINGKRFLALALEQCWLSTSHQVNDHAAPDDLRLVMAGCPVHSGVNMHWDPSSANAAFSFKVVESMVALNRVWLQCRIGVCSATSAGVQGNLFRCEDPAEACRAAKARKESTLQQVTVRGPIYLLPMRRERLAGVRPITGRQPDSLPQHFLLPQVAADPEPEESGHVPHSTLVGVTVEVAVAISVASFLVGAASTGVLWLLHSRAIRIKSVGRVEGVELESMLGRPRVPPAASSPTDNNGNCSGCPLLT